MPHLQYAPVAGSKLPGYAILDEGEDRVMVEFYDHGGQLYPGHHVDADTVEDAKKRAEDACRERIEASSDGPTDLHHWRPIPAAASDAVEYALGHRKRHPDGRE